VLVLRGCLLFLERGVVDCEGEERAGGYPSCWVLVGWWRCCDGSVCTEQLCEVLLLIHERAYTDRLRLCESMRSCVQDLSIIESV
jgi:hypothetical protein